ncbi:MAG: OmpH family outer membrane protein [Bacteroidales bacterium]|nr:OmpH family outer membrane protein [Bacteroidales bacterium]
MNLSKSLTYIFTTVVLMLSAQAYSQKYACVNTDYILKKIPEYANAQKRIDQYVETWQKEIEEKEIELNNLRKVYEQESYLLPDNLKKNRKDELIAKEKEIRALQQQRFGAGGDMDKKRSELLRPTQDRVYSAIERIAREKNYAIIFDKATNNTLLFVSKKYDISDDILEMLGYKSNDVSEDGAAANGEMNRKK